MEKYDEYLNKELCSECGGKCCKKSGCDYFVSDFEVLTKKYLQEILASGNISIVAALSFSTIAGGKKVCTPFLYLRARNEGRDIVDLFSFKTQCSMLTETGCSYTPEERPSGGINLIPDKKVCRPKEDPIEEILKWESYQGLLSKYVKTATGLSVMEKLRQDVEEMFYKLLIKDFDGVSPVEIADVLSSIDDLYTTFPEEYQKAKNRIKKPLRF